MNGHNTEGSSADMDVFLPALASDEDVLQDLSYACQSLERHGWEKIDNIGSAQRGYELIQACAKNPAIFKKCIQMIGTALQMQTFYGYQFYIKEIKDFGRVYRFILPTQDLLERDGPVAGLTMCENALYACRLFDRLLHNGLKKRALQEAFQLRFQELFSETIFTQPDSVEQSIRNLYPGTSLLPFTVKETIDMVSDTTEDLTDHETSTQRLSPLHEIDSLSDKSFPISQKCGVDWLHTGDEHLMETFLFAYRLCEINGNSNTISGIQAMALTEACIKNKDILYRALQTIERVLRYLEEHQLHYQKKYYANLGYVYTLKDYPDLTFEAGEGALVASELFVQMYQNGYQNLEKKTSFRTILNEIIETHDFAQEFPYFYTKFGDKMNIKASSAKLNNISVTQAVQQTITGQQHSSFWTLVVPIMLSFLSLFINRIKPEVQPVLLNLGAKTSDVISEHPFTLK